MNAQTWPDGTRKSTGNAFDWRNMKKSNIASEMQHAKRHSEISSETVNRKRAEGVDVATIRGLSDKSRQYARDIKRFYVAGKKVKKSEGGQ